MGLAATTCAGRDSAHALTVEENCTSGEADWTNVSERRTDSMSSNVSGSADRPADACGDTVSACDPSVDRRDSTAAATLVARFAKNTSVAVPMPTPAHVNSELRGLPAMR